MKAFSAVQLIATLMLLVSLVNSQKCQTDWIKLNSKCFYFETGLFDYEGAVQNCISKGGRLFEPKNDHANGRIAIVAKSRLNSPSDYWIGIDDVVNSGLFVYKSSGSKIRYSNWASTPTNNPDNNQATEDCAAVELPSALWIDTACTPNTKQSVCEDLQDDAEYWGPCNPGWNLIDGKCYKLVDLTTKFEAANQLCQSLGGKLFEPTYESQEEAVLSYYFGEIQSQAVWLGMTDQAIEGRFTFVSNDQPVEYYNWAKSSHGDQPNNQGNEEDCVMANAKVWDEVCCQIGNIAKPLCEEVPLPGCKSEPHWESAKGRCFYLGTELKTYDDAILDCQSKGGRLFEPRSEEANTLIYEYMRNSASIPYWIGVNALDNPGKFIYTNTRDPISYSSWEAGQPFAENKRAFCVQVQTHKAEWGDIHCGAKRKYVCEFPEVYQPYWDTIAMPTCATENLDFIFDLLFDSKQQEIATDTQSTSIVSGSNRFISIGGFNGAITGVSPAASYNFVYRFDLDTQQLCYHSTFPVTIKEVHAFEFKNQLHVCSAFTGTTTKKLLCWKWGASGWIDVTTPNNTIAGFISSVYIPNIGMWFIDDTDATSLILREDTGTFEEGVHWTLGRLRACTVMVTSTKVAQIGGDGPGAIAQTIDTYDFATGVEVINAYQLTAIRKHHGCVTIKGKNDHPTVAVVGSVIAPYLFYIELWDTVTMTSQLVPHPFELETNVLFRPTVVPYDDYSFLLVNSRVDLGNPDPSYLKTIFMYTYGFGWRAIAKNPSPLNAIEQTGVYLLKNPNLDYINTLDKCQ